MNVHADYKQNLSFFQDGTANTSCPPYVWESLIMDTQPPADQKYLRSILFFVVAPWLAQILL